MKIMSKILLLFVAAGFFFFSCKKNNNNNNNESLTTQDRNFINQASISNTAEIRAGQYADSTVDSTTDSLGTSIRAFAAKMVTDHTTAQNDLKTLGNSVNVAVTDSVDSMHSSQMDSLKMLSGRAFDSAYILSQIADHQAAINTFQQESNSGNRSAVINYANKYLPVLQMHLQMADSLATAMGFK
jgi:putative membrane protein